VVSCLPPVPTRTGEPGGFGAAPPSEPRLRTETGRISQVPGEPRLSIGTCSSTPAGCMHLTRAMPHQGPRYGKHEGTDIKSFEAQSHGAWTGCLRFAVPVARPHARLASSGWLDPPGRASTRRVPKKDFDLFSLHLNLLHQVRLARSRLATPAAPRKARFTAPSVCLPFVHLFCASLHLNPPRLDVLTFGDRCARSLSTRHRLRVSKGREAGEGSYLLRQLRSR
jgi:hypothetical protein